MSARQTNAKSDNLQPSNQKPYRVIRHRICERQLSASYPGAFRTLWCYLVQGKRGWSSGPLAGPMCLPHDATIALFVDNDGVWHVEGIVTLWHSRCDGITDPLMKGRTLRLPLTEPHESDAIRAIAAYPLRLGKWATDRLKPALHDFLEKKGVTRPPL